MSEMSLRLDENDLLQLLKGRALQVEHDDGGLTISIRLRQARPPHDVIDYHTLGRLVHRAETSEFESMGK